LYFLYLFIKVSCHRKQIKSQFLHICINSYMNIVIYIFLIYILINNGCWIGWLNGWLNGWLHGWFNGRFNGCRSIGLWSNVAVQTVSHFIISFDGIFGILVIRFYIAILSNVISGNIFLPNVTSCLVSFA